jgi:hypothetical protein
MGTAAHEAGTVDYVSPALYERLKQERVLGWIVFEVRILDYDEVASGFLNPAPQSGSFAHVVGLEKYTDRRKVLTLERG